MAPNVAPTMMGVLLVGLRSADAGVLSGGGCAEPSMLGAVRETNMAQEKNSRRIRYIPERIDAQMTLLVSSDWGRPSRFICNFFHDYNMVYACV